MPLIVFEGIDRSGKSSQCRLLLEHFRSIGRECDVLLMRYPDRNSIHTGEIINSFLLGKAKMSLTAASLLFLANLWEMKEAIIQALEKNQLVIMDRYVWSNVAYSTARGMDKEICTKLADGLPQPDCIIFLDVDPELASRRDSFGKEIFDNVDFQGIVSKTMKSLAQTSSVPVIIIDASLNQDKIFSEVKSALNYE